MIGVSSRQISETTFYPWRPFTLDTVSITVDISCSISIYPDFWRNSQVIFPKFEDISVLVEFLRKSGDLSIQARKFKDLAAPELAEIFCYLFLKRFLSNSSYLSHSLCHKFCANILSSSVEVIWIQVSSELTKSSSKVIFKVDDLLKPNANRRY